MTPLAVKVAPFANVRAKRTLVSNKITSYAQGHQAADIGLTLGTCWIPGGGLIAMAGAMAIQAPMVYKPLARDIAKIYLVNTLDDEVKATVNSAAIEGAEWDLAGAFGIEFFQEVLTDILTEIGLGAVIGLIPILGSVAAAVYDAKIAATLTWRVGISIALYYENGCEWLVDRKTTYEKARLLMAGGLSSKTENRADFNSFGQRVHGLRQHQATLLGQYFSLAKRMMGVDALEQVLRDKWKVDPELLEAVLTEVRRKRLNEGRPSAAARDKYIKCPACNQQYLREDEICPHCYTPCNGAQY